MKPAPYLFAAMLALAPAACAPAPAPAEQAAPLPGTLRLALGSSGKAGAVEIAPLSIVEESRCPSNVQCIQAGTVRVDTRIAISGVAGRHVLELGKPLTLNGYMVELINACPYPMIAGRPIARTDYRLTFLVTLAGQLTSPPYQSCN